MAINLHTFEIMAAANRAPLNALYLSKASGADVRLLGEMGLLSNVNAKCNCGVSTTDCLLKTMAAHNIVDGIGLSEYTNNGISKFQADPVYQEMVADR